MDYKEYQIYLGKKAKAYKIWYSLASKGLKEWRRLLSEVVDVASSIRLELESWSIPCTQKFDVLTIQYPGIGIKMREAGYMVEGTDEIELALNPVHLVSKQEIISVFE